jgi:tetratricopeptide (TPR) repeat protein
MNIFFSYPHDANAPLVERIKADLEARGHRVWFDAEQIKTGGDWRERITRGILESDQVVAFLSCHAVRDPGVCLNEIAIALAEKGEALVTVLVEPEERVAAPVSITHIQWLRMEDWAERAGDPGWYASRLEDLVQAIEHPGQAVRHQELETLRLGLDPLSFHADIAPHLPGFTGRQWIIDRYHQWLQGESASRVLRIEGGPGLGKTAVASYLAHNAKSSVLGVHLCQWNKRESRSAVRLVRSLAYQLATRLPDYRARLLNSVAIQRPDTQQGKDAGSLWGELIAAPLMGSGRGNIDRQRLALIIDGLDEASESGTNDIVKLLAEEIGKLPAWIAVVLTGRPDPEVTQRLARYQPLVISEDDQQNLQDLKAYTDAWMQQEVQAGRLNQTQAGQASQALLDRSRGAFLYLSQARAAVAEGLLDLSQPQRLPSGLGAIYLNNFERRFGQGKDQYFYESRVRPLLEYVLASPEPLPLQLASQLLDWGQYDGPQVLQSLGSLIKRNRAAKSEEQTLSPFHHSAGEWLQDPEAAGRFHVNANLVREPLTRVVWQRYRDKPEPSGYEWEVLPVMLPRLESEAQHELLGQPTWQTSQVLYKLADGLAPKLRFSEAADVWGIQVRFSERMAISAPESAQILRDLSVSFSCNQLGELLRELGRTKEALECFEKSLSIAKRLAAGEPENALLANALSLSYHHLGNVQRDLGNVSVALDYCEKSLRIVIRLAASAPKDAELERALGVSYNKLGDLQRDLGNHQAALEYYEQGLRTAERLAVIAPENVEYARDLSVCYDSLSDLQRDLGRTQSALGWCEQSVRIRKRLLASVRESAEFARDLGISYNKLGDLQRDLGNNKAALKYYEQSLLIFKRLVASARENTNFALDMSISYERLGGLQRALGNTHIALGYFDQSLCARERIAAIAPENVQFTRALRISYEMLGDFQRDLGNTHAALGCFEKCLVIAERLCTSVPENATFARDRCASLWKMAEASPAPGQRAWWQRTHNALTAMKSDGMFSAQDETYLEQARAKLDEPA